MTIHFQLIMWSGIWLSKFDLFLFHLSLFNIHGSVFTPKRWWTLSSPPLNGLDPWIEERKGERRGQGGWLWREREREVIILLWRVLTSSGSSFKFFLEMCSLKVWSNKNHGDLLLHRKETFGRVVSEKTPDGGGVGEGDEEIRVRSRILENRDWQVSGVVLLKARRWDEGRGGRGLSNSWLVPLNN